MKLNPFKDIIFTTRTWIQLILFLLFFIFDILIFFSTYNYIKLYLYYTRALENIALNEKGNAKEKLDKIVTGPFPYANLLAASLELESNSPDNALEILNKINYTQYKDKKAYGFSEILKAIAYILKYKESKSADIIPTIDNHLNNAAKVCPNCLEINVVAAFMTLLQNKSIEAYRKLNEIASSANIAIEKNALYEAIKYLGEIDLLTYNKCENAKDKFQKATLYNPNDNLSLMKYLYCYIKTFKLQGIKNEVEELKNTIIYKRIANIQGTLTPEEKYYYSMILLEIGNLYNNAGSIEKAYDNYREGLRQYFCNFDIITAYSDLLQQELANKELKPIEREIKSKELQNLEENLASKIASTPFEISEFLNCIAMKYYKIKNDINKAIELLDRAKNKSPNNSKALTNLSILYLKTGNKEAAQEIVKEAEKQGIHSSILDKIKTLIK